MEALLVIDVATNEDWNNRAEDLPPKKFQVAQSLMKILGEWRTQSKLVIFVVFPYCPNGYMFRETSQLTGQEGLSNCIVCDLPKAYRLVQFLEHRHGSNFEPAFIKQSQDAFANPYFDEFVRSRNITKLFLAGCMTYACVLATAQRAARLGIDITLLKDCVYPALENEQDCQEWIEYAGQNLLPGSKVRITVE